MTRSVSLETLYERFDAIAEGGSPSADSSVAHQAVLTRLIDNRALAEASGWTNVALERSGGLGRLYLEGTLPSGHGRSVVPDWLGAALESFPVHPAAPDSRSLPQGLPNAQVAPRAEVSEASWLDDGGQ
jgi:hypothetical protein